MGHVGQLGWTWSHQEGVMEIQKVPLIESLTHWRGFFDQARAIGLNVGSHGRAIKYYPYGGGVCERSLDFTPHT